MPSRFLRRLTALSAIAAVAAFVLFSPLGHAQVETLPTAAATTLTELPSLDAHLGSASARTVEGQTLVVSTGMVERTWKLTPYGLRTIGVRNTATGRQWADATSAAPCDWEYSGLVDSTSNAQLTSLSTGQDDDEGFTTRHLAVTAEFFYPSVQFHVRYVIWAYPDSPGLRTQVWLKGDGAKVAGARPHNLAGSRSEVVPGQPSIASAARSDILIPTGRVDSVPVDASRLARRYVGYFNDTQHRKSASTPLFREQYETAPLSAPERVDWASFVSLEHGSEGLILLKESHKCANQYGVDTGDFVVSASGVANSGTSLTSSEITRDAYKWCWAAWMVMYEGGNDGRELTLKRFDRLRFPILPSRDMGSLVCSWGQHGTFRAGLTQGTEKAILPEMRATADLGFDLQLIDAGWQCDLDQTDVVPSATNGWNPHPAAYPEGWRNVSALQKELGIGLGLWGMAQQMNAEDMIRNWGELHLRQYKLDYAQFKTHGALENVIRETRRFILHTGHRSAISWDITENAARVGYFWAREYGNVHLINLRPANVPWLTLRNYWHLARYNNLNKYQLTVQNPDGETRDGTDAWQHSADYCAAIGLFGIPELMSRPHLYSDAAKSRIRKLMAAYKVHQLDLFTGYVFPLGDEPTNATWTGFQCIRPGEDHGYLLVFRELHQPEAGCLLPLRQIRDCTVELTNLLTGTMSTVRLDAAGRLPVRIEAAPGFRFLRYRILR